MDEKIPEWIVEPELYAALRAAIESGLIPEPVEEQIDPAFLKFWTLFQAKLANDRGIRVLNISGEFQKVYEKAKEIQRITVEVQWISFLTAFAVYAIIHIIASIL